ncbi:MAG: hypothetical protein IPN86_04265 [Saprospiraceae bacterium]|nr:hypothetical protein [Saprospiraceae bacterium]
MDGEKEIDEVMVSVFRSPKHSLPKIYRDILPWITTHQSSHQFFANKHSCKIRIPGEFTLRAFLNGRLDLS